MATTNELYMTHITCVVIIHDLYILYKIEFFFSFFVFLYFVSNIVVSDYSLFPGLLYTYVSNLNVNI